MNTTIVQSGYVTGAVSFKKKKKKQKDRPSLRTNEEDPNKCDFSAPLCVNCFL